MILANHPLKEFLQRSAGIDIDNSDMKRVHNLIGSKLNDLLVIGVRNASFNDRNVVMEPDLPLTKGFLRRRLEFRQSDEPIDLKPILENLATYPPLARALNADVEAMLPELAGMLAMLAGRTVKILDPTVKNPDAILWARVTNLMELLL
jgi:Domain of unknown function (DUF1931)